MNPRLAALIRDVLAQVASARGLAGTQRHCQVSQPSAVAMGAIVCTAGVQDHLHPSVSAAPVELP